MDDPLLAGTPPRASSRENQLIMTDITLARAESPQEMRRDRSFGTLEAMAKPMPSTMPCSPSGNFGGWDESPAPSVPSSPRATRWNNQSLFRKYESPPRHTVPACEPAHKSSPPLLQHDLHAIDATPARWRGDCGFSSIPSRRLTG